MPGHVDVNRVVLSEKKSSNFSLTTKVKQGTCVSSFSPTVFESEAVFFFTTTIFESVVSMFLFFDACEFSHDNHILFKSNP